MRGKHLVDSIGQFPDLLRDHSAGDVPHVAQRKPREGDTADAAGHVADLGVVAGRPIREFADPVSQLGLVGIAVGLPVYRVLWNGHRRVPVGHFFALARGQRGRHQRTGVVGMPQSQHVPQFVQGHGQQVVTFLRRSVGGRQQDAVGRDQRKLDVVVRRGVDEPAHVGGRRVDIDRMAAHLAQRSPRQIDDPVFDIVQRDRAGVRQFSGPPAIDCRRDQELQLFVVERYRDGRRSR